MSSVLGRGFVRYVSGALLAGLMFASSAQAQQQGGSPAAKQIPQPSAEQRAAEQKALQQLFLNSPSGGGDLMRAIRDMLLADHSAVYVILDSLSATCKTPDPCANPQQQTAIGNGMGLAAQALIGTGQVGQAIATELQEDLAGAGSNLASVAFAEITGNVQIGAGGGGGGGGAGSGPTGSGPPEGGPNSSFSANASFGTSNTGGGGLTGGTATGVGQLTSPF
jgi:hypothetical protein